MPEFWVSSGHQLTRLTAGGLMAVTDELLLAWLARPELLPPPEACPQEGDLHARLMQNPRAEVPDRLIEALADPDAQENWRFFLAMRAALLAEGTVEGGYLRIVSQGISLPYVLLAQLVHLILRNALEGCLDPLTLRAAELFFRPQRAFVKEGLLHLVDQEIAAELEAEMHRAPLLAMFHGGVEALDVLNEANAWTYWSRSDAHTTVLNLGGDPGARRGLANTIEAWLRHLIALDTEVTPHTRVDDAEFRWFVGLDPVGTAIGNALWRGEKPPSDPIALFSLRVRDRERFQPAIADAPVWLILGLGQDGVVRLKPQNLLVNLPLAAEALH